MKDIFFPRGDILSDEQEYERCLWRETSLALHLLQKSVNPDLSLSECIQNWSGISKDLAEPSRKRKKQLTGVIEWGSLS